MMRIEHSTPKHRVSVRGETFEINGHVELDRGCLIFRGPRSEILKILATGQWEEVTRVSDGP